jgi:hypothetical protein
MTRSPLPAAMVGLDDIGGCFVVKASNDWPLVFIYFGNGVASRSLARLLTGSAARDPQCRATDRSRHCQAARAIAEGLICLTKIKVLPSRQSLSFF